MNHHTGPPDLFENVRHVSRGRDWQAMLEGPYWQQVMAGLQHRMGEAFRALDVLFVHQPGGAPLPPDLPLHSGTVLVILSDETGALPLEAASKCRVVFKNYLDRQTENIFPVPPGYTHRHLAPADRPSRLRRLPVFFSGNINHQRLAMWFGLQNRGVPRCPHGVRRILVAGIRYGLLRRNLSATLPGSYIRFTRGFTRGLDAGAYTEHLSQAVLALCPPGFRSHETFRHFEAMRAGCIVLSAPLPDTWYYRNGPILQLTDWRACRPAILKILQDPQQRDALQRRTLQWWNRVCGETAVAAYMAERIQARRFQ